MWRRHISLSFAVLAAAVIVSATIGIPATAALFTSEYPVTAEIGSGHVFPGERDTAPFAVTDASSGTAVDASNPYAFANDNLIAVTSAWASSFAAGRYVEFALNSPLPTGVGMSSASFALRFASATPGSTACFYFEIRSEATGDPIEVHGSAGSPLGCVTGTSLATTTTSLVAISTTTIANDMRVRVYASDSAADAVTIDAATISGDYGLATFTLYPIEVRDLADTSIGVTHWGPAGP
ncbi:MAG: hypothetical protein ABI797_05210 [Chloroflexota bacterium]